MTAAVMQEVVQSQMVVAAGSRGTAVESIQAAVRRRRLRKAAGQTEQEEEEERSD